MEEQTQPVQETQSAKEGIKPWVWALIILILIAIGIGIYFWLTGDSSQIANGGSSIPQPPALPSE